MIIPIYNKKIYKNYDYFYYCSFQTDDFKNNIKVVLSNLFKYD